MNWIYVIEMSDSGFLAGGLLCGTLRPYYDVILLILASLRLHLLVVLSPSLREKH